MFSFSLTWLLKINRNLAMQTDPANLCNSHQTPVLLSFRFSRIMYYDSFLSNEEAQNIYDGLNLKECDPA